MAPALYYFPLSPPVRVVLLSCRMAEVDIELRLIDRLQNEHLKSDFVDINPQHCLPTLDDDGFIMWESRAVATYLISAYGKDDSLYPTGDLKQRALVDQRLQFDLGTLYARIYDFFMPVIFEGAGLDERKKARLEEALRWFDEILKDKTWAIGESFTVADIALCVTISQLEAFEFEFSAQERVIEWYERCKEALEPFGYQEINQSAVEKFTELYKSKLENDSDDKKMPLTLYYYPLSPPCRAVMLLGKYLNIEFDLQLINPLEKETLKKEFVDINPQHTIPTLIEDDLVLWESRAIMTYLVSAHSTDDSLYPSDARIRAIVDQRLQFDLGTLYQRMMDYAFPTITLGAHLDEKKAKRLQEALDWLNTFLAGSKWVAGGTFTVADIALCVTVSQIEAFDIHLKRFGYIVEWMKRCKVVLEGFDYEEINQKAADTLGDVFRSKLKQ